jgi:hypothetical protein
MKKIIIIIAVLGFTVLNSVAQQLTPAENALLDNYLKSIVTSEREKIVSDTLAKVFPGTILKMKSGFSASDGISWCTETGFLIKNGKLLEFSRDSLMLILKSGFSIKSEADAKIFETALDKIYPVSWTDLDMKKHFKKANKWYFSRGDFFDFYSGFEATTDATGKITAVRYDMKVVAK